MISMPRLFHYDDVEEQWLRSGGTVYIIYCWFFFVIFRGFVELVQNLNYSERFASPY